MRYLYTVIIMYIYLCIGEEGNFFEGDIRLRPGVDPYTLTHRSKRGTMQDIAPSSANINTSPQGDEPAGATGLTANADPSSNETSEEFNPDQSSGGLWPDGIVYYTIDDRIGKYSYCIIIYIYDIICLTDNLYRQTFITAIEAWEYYTCLKFIKATKDTKAYLNLTVDAEG